MRTYLNRCSTCFACLVLTALTLTFVPTTASMEDSIVNTGVPENIYRAELVSYPGAYGFEIGKSAIILVSDQDLEMLSDPDRLLNLSLTF
ncbi:hypothetical protein HRbin16_03187 [bacterium HR16]|nr:hypothetical protein HRbin16_03187 [bacterium HR16]